MTLWCPFALEQPHTPDVGRVCTLYPESIDTSETVLRRQYMLFSPCTNILCPHFISANHERVGQQAHNYSHLHMQFYQRVPFPILPGIRPSLALSACLFVCAQVFEAPVSDSVSPWMPTEVRGSRSAAVSPSTNAVADGSCPLACAAFRWAATRPNAWLPSLAPTPRPGKL